MSAFSMCQLLAESLDWAQSCHSSSLSQRLLRGSGCEAWQPPRNVFFTADTGSAGGACRIYEFTTLDRSYPSQRGPEGAVSKSSHLFSAPEQSRGQLSIDGNCVVPSPRSAEEREMASSAQIAANRLNAQEGTEPRNAQGARRRCGGAHCGIRPRSSAASAPATPSGRIPREIVDWESRADLSNEISGRNVGEKPIPCRREPLATSLRHSAVRMRRPCFTLPVWRRRAFMHRLSISLSAALSRRLTANG